MYEAQSPVYCETKSPDQISEELLPVIQELGLEENCRQLAMEGWTVVRNAASPAFFTRLRNTILEKCRDDQLYWLLHKDSVFAEAALNPKAMALAEFSVGRGFLLSNFNTSIKGKGGESVPLHCDMGWLPAPLPEHNYQLTMCWVCDGYSKEAGGTTIVPGSHLLRRPPSLDETQARAGAISIECPPGSLAMWNGTIWHGATRRKIDGERVVAHVSYQRLGLRSAEDYSAYADRLIKEHGPKMAQLLGRDDFLENHGVDFEKLRQTYDISQR